jgi:hypothetical protein
MGVAHAVNTDNLPHRPDIAELGNVLQQLAALGDHLWLEDILVLARKRLRTVRESLVDEASRASKDEP